MGQPTNKLSMGERQRVMIARALATQPRCFSPTSRRPISIRGAAVKSSACSATSAARRHGGAARHARSAGHLFADCVHALRDGRIWSTSLTTSSLRSSGSESADRGDEALEIADLYRVRLQASSVLVQELLPCSGSLSAWRCCLPARWRREPRRIGTPTHERARRPDAVPARCAQREGFESDVEQVRVCRACALRCR